MPIETRFKCKLVDDDFITVNSHLDNKEIHINVFNNGNIYCNYILDIPTAIKLSKTIRTHINKVKGI